MLFRRKGTALIYDVKPHLIPLFKGNEAYEEVEEPKAEAEKPKKTTKKKATRED